MSKKQVGGLVASSILAFASQAAAGSLKAYVANAFDGTVSVVDTRRGTTITTLPAGCDPRTVAAHPDGSRVYVGNACLGDLDAHPGTVTVIDTASDSVVAEVPVGVEPIDLAVDPEGTRLLVANLGCGDPECTAAVPGSISLVDTATNVATQEIDVGGRPKGILFHPDGDRLYVAVAGMVQVRDAATFDPIGMIAVSPTSGGMAIDRRGRRLWVVTHTGAIDGVTLVDVESNEIIGQVPVGVAANAITLDRGRVYVASAGESPNGPPDLVTIIGAHTAAVLDELDGGWAPNGLALHRGSGRLVVTNFYSGDVLIMNRRSGRVIHSAQAGAGANDVVLVRTRR